MPAHFQPRIEKIVFLVRFVRAFLDLFQLQIVPSLLTDLCDTDHAELKAAGFGIVLHDLSAQP